MQEYIRICPICEKENDRNRYKGRYAVPGWFDYYVSEEVADTTCNYHKEQKLVKGAMTCIEFNILRKISTDPSFIRAMNDLKEKDIIEYNLKLSQFKSQVEQQQSTSSSTPCCPHCRSTNIKPISGLNRGASIAMWGIFSKKINKSFECKKCGYTW